MSIAKSSTNCKKIYLKLILKEFSESSIDGAEGSLAALLSAFGPTTIGLEGSQSYQAISEALGSTALMSKDETGVPHAYLNYLLFDENFTPIGIGFQHITDAGRVTESSMDAVETVSLEEIEISESGYLYTWVSNESNWDVTVYFDDFRIEHDSYIVSSQDYYAFGAVHNAEKRSVGLNNKHQYQGKEWQADLGLGLLNFHARQYDPYLGRFTSTDPMAHSYASASPYAGMLNNPVCIIDPDGREPITLATAIIVGGIIGAYTGGAIANDGELNPLQWNYTDRGAWKTYAGIVGGGVLGIIAGASVYGVIAGDISLKVGLITPIATIGVTGHTSNWFQDFSWTTSAGGQGSIQSDKAITGNSLLTGSNAQQSVYTGGYAQTSFNDPMQDYITDQILKRSGVRILPDLAVDSRYNSSLFGVHDRQTGTSIDWLNASGGVVGIFGMGFSNLDKLHPGYATAAKVGLGLGFASAFISGYQFSQNPTYANGFDLLMNGTSLVPGGAAVGVPYFILNTVVQGATNKTIGQHFFGDKRVIE